MAFLSVKKLRKYVKKIQIVDDIIITTIIKKVNSIAFLKNGDYYEKERLSYAERRRTSQYFMGNKRTPDFGRDGAAVGIGGLDIGNII